MILKSREERGILDFNNYKLPDFEILLGFRTAIEYDSKIKYALISNRDENENIMTCPFFINDIDLLLNNIKAIENNYKIKSIRSQSELIDVLLINDIKMSYNDFSELQLKAFPTAFKVHNISCHEYEIPEANKIWIKANKLNCDDFSNWYNNK